MIFDVQTLEDIANKQDIPDVEFMLHIVYADGKEFTFDLNTTEATSVLAPIDEDIRGPKVALRETLNPKYAKLAPVQVYLEGTAPDDAKLVQQGNFDFERKWMQNPSEVNLEVIGTIWEREFESWFEPEAEYFDDEVPAEEISNSATPSKKLAHSRILTKEAMFNLLMQYKESIRVETFDDGYCRRLDVLFPQQLIDAYVQASTTTCDGIQLAIRMFGATPEKRLDSPEFIWQEFFGYALLRLFPEKESFLKSMIGKASWGHADIQLLSEMPAITTLAERIAQKWQPDYGTTSPYVPRESQKKHDYTLRLRTEL